MKSHLRSYSRIALLLALTLVSGVAKAQSGTPASSVRDSLDTDAGASFDEGGRLYKAAEYTAARAAFLAAYAKSGDPRILYNAAVCDKALGRYARAIATLRTSLAATDRPLPAEYTQRASVTIATLSRYVAFVTLSSPVEGVSFTIDGERTKDNPVALETGTHSISAASEGFDPLVKSVSVKAGDVLELQFPLEPSRTPGSLSIVCATTDVNPCDIKLDGVAVGRAPLTLSRPPGNYSVEAYVRGRPFDQQRVEFANGKASALTLTGRALPTAKLRLSTGSPDDTVSVDGEMMGRSGLEVSLPVGEHRVIVARPGTPTTRAIDIVLRPNETRDLRLDLDTKSSLSPWWFVAGGAVVVTATVIGVFLATRPTSFEGRSAGTLNPYVVTASRMGVF